MRRLLCRLFNLRIPEETIHEKWPPYSMTGRLPMFIVPEDRLKEFSTVRFRPLWAIPADSLRGVKVIWMPENLYAFINGEYEGKSEEVMTDALRQRKEAAPNA